VTVPLHLRWGDQDPYHHVNNVAIAGLLEQARALVFWPDDGPLPALSVAAPVHVVVAQAHITYVRPIDYRPEPISAELSVTALGGASFDIGYRLLQDDAECVAATTRMALVDAASGAPVRLSTEVRSWLQRFTASEQAVL
jgi:acyl-CoA thioester hydrolase